MKQLFNLIQINHNFRKSVNLELDLEDYERIGGYIPTRSSVAILQRYFECVSGRNSENVTFLIGPYGKGKSHLLLVLLAMLHGEQDEIADVVDKIAKIDANMNENAEGKEETVLQNYMKKGFPKYLPVLINSNARNNLNESFIFALQEALKRDSLDAIAPGSYYTAALEAIDKWKRNFKTTYQNLEKMRDVRGLRRELEAKNPAALEEFKKIYPQLTSGSYFAPMIQTDAKAVYNEINRILTTQYGYSGIFIVFDEFSKYLEGHPVEGFSNDMKALQDMCELCNASKGEIIMTMVAHKSIHDYTRSIDETVKNTFRGIEGRVQEFEFIVTAQNNYELIADTIVKKEPDFSRECAKLLKQDEIREFLEESYALACFTSIFQWEEFVETIGKGCFPMTPVCAYALFHISERVAQNERTIFTFLSDEGQGSLSWILAKKQDALIGIDKIYDYFKALFRETADQPQIHNEWQKAEYAISKTTDVLEIQILKAIAMIRMIHREDELPARDNVLRLALAVSKDAFGKAIAGLMKKNLITYRSSQGLYAFRANVGVDVDKRIEKKMEELRNRFAVCDSLKKISELEYELPKKYNQKYAITRYFQYEYMEKDDFLKLSNSQYLFEEKFADGKIIVLAHVKKSDKKEVQEHLETLQDSRIVVLANEEPVINEELLLKYEAVEALKSEAISLIKEGTYVEENEILIQELGLYEEDLAFEINAALEQDYLPENGSVIIFSKNRRVKCKNSVEFNTLLSEICEEYYGFSPRVNHELLNIEVVGAQYLKARNAVITSLLEEKDCCGYLAGTNPESMVYRAAFVHTTGDDGCQRIFDEIGVFFNSCAGKKQAFLKLYACLQGEKYGTRKGIIPLFLAKKLADSEGTAVIYLKNKELEVTAETLNNVNAFPEKYELYIEPKADEKDRYLKKLEEAFCKKGSFALSKQSRINGIIGCMQKWYRSLPQYAVVSTDYPEELQATISTIKNQLRRAEVNPREVLFDKIPGGLKEESYDMIVDKILQAKTLMNGKLSALMEEVAGEIRDLFGVSKESSLKACLVEWYQNQSQASKSHILSTSVSSLMNYLETLSTNDEEEIISRLSRIVLDMYVEDWNDATKEQFVEELSRIREEIESIQKKVETTSNKSRLILQDVSGNEIAKYYDADVSDSTSVYLQNMIEEALEDFGDTLEMNQKVAVLVQAIEKLLQQ